MTAIASWRRPPTLARVVWIDGLRGLAVLLMVLDHGLVVVEPSSPLRVTVTRAALPLFMFTAAMVWRPALNRRRLAWMLVCLVVELATFPVLGIPLPGVMLGLVLVTGASWRWPRLGREWAVLAAAGGLLSWVYLGVAPGVVLGWWGVGRLMHLGTPHALAGVGRAMPAWVRFLGRHPIGAYAGHLVVLAGLVSL